MKKILSFLAAVFILAGAAPAQVRLSGYFSAVYLQGFGRSASLPGGFVDPAAGLLLSGEWTPQFNYLLEFRTGTDWKPEIEQAWAGWTASESMRFRLGLFLVPFGLYNEANRPFQTLLVAAPYPYGEAFPASWRDIGAVVDGKFGVFRYAGYVGNGLAEADSLAGGQQFKDNNKKRALGLRLSASLSSELNVGGSYCRGRQDSDAARNLTLIGGDLSWMTPNVHFTAEYTRADVDNPAGYARGRAEGWNIQLGLPFGDFTPLAAYEKSRTNDPYHGAGWTSSGTPGAGLFENHERWAIGLTYTPYANIVLKIEYDIQNKAGIDGRDAVLRVQSAVHF